MTDGSESSIGAALALAGCCWRRPRRHAPTGW